MVRFKSIALRRTALSLLLFGVCTVVFGQTGEWAEATRGVMSVYSSLAKLLRVIMGIGALFVLAEIVLKLMSGDKESARKLLWWLMGLSMGFLFLEFLSGASFF